MFIDSPIIIRMGREDVPEVYEDFEEFGDDLEEEMTFGDLVDYQLPQLNPFAICEFKGTSWWSLSSWPCQSRVESCSICFAPTACSTNCYRELCDLGV